MIAPRYCRIDLDRNRRSVVTHHGPDIKTEHYQSEFLALEVLLVPDVLIGRNHHRVSRRGSCLEEFAVFKLRIKLLYDFGDAHAIIIPGKVSGAWVFRDTRLQVVTVIENLEDLSIEEVMEQFDVTREQITAVLEFVAQSLKTPIPPQAAKLVDAHSLRPRSATRRFSCSSPTRCVTAKARGWERLSNWALLKAAEDAAIDLLFTTNHNFRYQQNLTDRKIAVVVITGTTKWSCVRLHLERIAATVNEAHPGSYAEVKIPFN